MTRSRDRVYVAILWRKDAGRGSAGGTRISFEGDVLQKPTTAIH